MLANLCAATSPAGGAALESRDHHRACERARRRRGDDAPWMEPELISGISAMLRQQGEGFADLDAAVAGAKALTGKTQAPDDLRGHLRQTADGRYHWRWDPRAVDAIDIGNLAYLEP